MYNVPLYNDELYGVQFMELQPVDAVTPVAVEALTLYYSFLDPLTLVDSTRLLYTTVRCAETIRMADWNTIDEPRSNQDWSPEH